MYSTSVSLDHFTSKLNVQSCHPSRFNLIDDDENNSGGTPVTSSGGACSNRASRTDLNSCAQNVELLTPQQKDAVRFIRWVKFSLARREFKNAFKPYDIKDVMQQYSEGHADVVGRVRYMQSRINTVNMGLIGLMKVVQEMQMAQMDRMDRLERTVQSMASQLLANQNNQHHCCHQIEHRDFFHHHHHQQHSPHYSDDTSTIFAQTPNADSHQRHQQKAKFIWPPVDDEHLDDVIEEKHQMEHKDDNNADDDKFSCYSSTTGSPKWNRSDGSKRHRHFSN